MRRLMFFMLAVLALVGCSGAPDAARSTPATTISETAAVGTAAPTSGPTAGPTSGPTSGAAALATVTLPAVPSVAPGTVSERARQEYNALIVLKAAADLLGQAAGPQPSPAADDPAGGALASGIATLLKAAGDKLKQPEADPALAEVWPHARAAHASLLELHGRWAAGEVTPAELAEGLGPLQQQLGQLLGAADSAVTARYGVDPDQFRQRRQDAVQSLVERFVTPTPLP